MASRKLGRRIYEVRRTRERLRTNPESQEESDTPNDRLARGLIWLGFARPDLYEELRIYAASGGIRTLSTDARKVFNLLAQMRDRRLQRKG